MHFIGRVILFFANNSLTECLITTEILDNFLDPEVFFSSHAMFINASIKEFTLVNNTIPSYDIAFEHLLYYKMVANVNIDYIFKNTKIYSILIRQSFPFMLI